MWGLSELIYVKCLKGMYIGISAYLYIFLYTNIILCESICIFIDNRYMDLEHVEAKLASSAFSNLPYILG